MKTKSSTDPYFKASENTEQQSPENQKAKWPSVESSWSCCGFCEFAAVEACHLCRYTVDLFNDLQPNCIKDDTGFDRRLVSVNSSRMMKYSSNVFCQNNKGVLHPQGINLSKYRKLIFMDALCSLKEWYNSCISQAKIWEDVNYNSRVKWILQKHMNKFGCSGL